MVANPKLGTKSSIKDSMTTKIVTSKTFKTPRTIYLQTPSDFTPFEETLRTVCEKFLSLDWDWTFRVGGKVHKEIIKNDPDNKILQVIQKGEKVSIHVKEEDEEEKEKIEISDELARALGKKKWEIEKVKEEQEKFFKGNLGIFEEQELLSVRKEIWDWMVVCVEGEKKNLFCAHLVRETDKWDITITHTNKEFSPHRKL